MIKATGGKGKVAILLGASGNNVTTDRTKGFVDQIKAEAPGIEIVAQQTGEFARDKGQQVIEQLIQSKPDITAIYAENDEMGLGAVTALEGRRQEARQGRQDRLDRRHPQRRAGHRRRRDQRRHRVQPALRPAGLRDRPEVLRAARRSPRTSSSPTASTTRPTPRNRSAGRTDPLLNPTAPAAVALAAGHGGSRALTLGQRKAKTTHGTTRSSTSGTGGGRAHDLRRARSPPVSKRFPGVLALDDVSFSAARGGGARPGRRERRRQVHPHQGADRCVPAGRGRDCVYDGRPVRFARPLRGAAGRYLHDLPGGQPRPADERGAQPLPGPRAPRTASA